MSSSGGLIWGLLKRLSKRKWAKRSGAGEAIIINQLKRPLSVAHICTVLPAWKYFMETCR